VFGGTESEEILINFYKWVNCLVSEQSMFVVRSIWN